MHRSSLRLVNEAGPPARSAGSFPARSALGRKVWMFPAPRADYAIHTTYPETRDPLVVFPPPCAKRMGEVARNAPEGALPAPEVPPPPHAHPLRRAARVRARHLPHRSATGEENRRSGCVNVVARARRRKMKYEGRKRPEEALVMASREARGGGEGDRHVHKYRVERNGSRSRHRLAAGTAGAGRAREGGRNTRPGIL